MTTQQQTTDNEWGNAHLLALAKALSAKGWREWQLFV